MPTSSAIFSIKSSAIAEVSAQGVNGYLESLQSEIASLSQLIAVSSSEVTTND
jgi:hypothetical protein